MSSPILANRLLQPVHLASASFTISLRGDDNKLTINTPTEKADSVHSDEPAPATSSNIFVPAIPHFSLEKSFPSILSTVNLIRSSTKGRSVIALGSLSQIFCTCLKSIVHSMDRLPHDVRLKPEYEVAHFAVIFTGNLFKAEVSRQLAAKDQFNAQMALELVDIAIASLRSFLAIAERILAENKPLPHLPSENDHILRAEEPIMATMVHEPLANKEGSEVSVSDQDNTANFDKLHTMKVSRENIVKSPIHRCQVHSSGAHSCCETNKLFFTPSFLCADNTLVSHDVMKSGFAPNTLRGDGKSQRGTWGLDAHLSRQSLVYYINDPHCTELEASIPLQLDATAAIRFDRDGSVKAASLVGLVHILTSKESVTDQEFAPTFFTSFRFFTTPALFLCELVKRYDEQPRGGLGAEELQFWTWGHMATQIRVVKTICLWLDLYWKPDSDSGILGALQTFIVDRIARELPESLVSRALRALDQVRGDKPGSRRSKKAYDLNYICHTSRGAAPSPTYFSIIIHQSLDPNLTLLSFNSSLGREEFAHQITIYLSERFQLIDPEDAIMYWHLKESSDRKREAERMEVSAVLGGIIESERALCSWVTSSIIDQSEKMMRCDILEFWLDVSARCMRLRNFSGAHSILIGLSHGCITRLKQTVLIVSVSSKQQFHVLQDFFSGKDNYAAYRESLSSIKPTIPILAPFIRDVVSALSVIPTYIGITDGSEEKVLINLRSYRVITKTAKAMESCLIPYKFSRNEVFATWLTDLLAAFPSEHETSLNDKFYGQSKNIEARVEALATVDPWLYTVTRVEQDDVECMVHCPRPQRMFKPPTSVTIKDRLSSLKRK